MLSRVADSLYWMSRYLERAEHTTRVVAVNLNLSLDRLGDDDPVGARLLASIPPPPADALGAVPELGGPDSMHRTAIAACLTAARENTRQVREQVSSEMWEQLNRLYLEVRDGNDEAWSTRTHEALAPIADGTYLFQGITDATMTHNEGWHYIQVGRFLERACNTALLLDAHFEAFLGKPDQPIEVSEFVEWVGVLKSVCAFEGYTRFYTADLRASRVAEFLILNADFPRSIRFAAGRVEAALKAIARHTGKTNGRAERLAGRFRASLDFAQVDEFLTGGLRERLKDIVRQTTEIHAAMTETYITYPIAASLAS